MKNTKQAIFMNMITGILLYSVIIGFFNDYTHLLHTGTYSTTFALAIVMQLLTYLTLRLKDLVIKQFPTQRSLTITATLAICIWLVIFLSKFVFLWAISAVFRNEVEVSGFVGLISIIATMTIARSLLNWIYKSLAD